MNHLSPKTIKSSSNPTPKLSLKINSPNFKISLIKKTKKSKNSKKPSAKPKMIFNCSKLNSTLKGPKKTLKPQLISKKSNTSKTKTDNSSKNSTKPKESSMSKTSKSSISKKICDDSKPNSKTSTKRKAGSGLKPQA